MSGEAAGERAPVAQPAPNVVYVAKEAWAAAASVMIQDAVESFLDEQGSCRVMLTGGRGAEKLYGEWARDSRFGTAGGVTFFFGDERCVSTDDEQSNYGMAMRTLFRSGVPEGCSVLRMEADASDREAAAMRYEELLPERIDVLLLGVGEDGHVASLFPGAPALHEALRLVLPVSGPKAPHDRLTVTPQVIAKARSVFVLATGELKARVLAQALEAPLDVDTLPARLVLNGNWLLDSPLPGADKSMKRQDETL